jgi:hypothetical protein
LLPADVVKAKMVQLCNDYSSRWKRADSVFVFPLSSCLVTCNKRLMRVCLPSLWAGLERTSSLIFLPFPWLVISFATCYSGFIYKMGPGSLSGGDPIVLLKKSVRARTEERWFQYIHDCTRTWSRPDAPQARLHMRAAASLHRGSYLKLEIVRLGGTTTMNEEWSEYRSCWGYGLSCRRLPAPRASNIYKYSPLLIGTCSISPNPCQGQRSCNLYLGPRIDTPILWSTRHRGDHI